MAIELGAIGLGGLGGLLLEGAAGREDVDVVAGADVDDGAREAFEDEYGARSYGDHEAMLEHEDLDAVTIVTPHTLHYEQARACLEADAHVLLEKPMVTRTSEAIDLVRRARERDRVLQIGYQRHLDPGYQAVREVVRSGRIGDVHMASCYLAQDWIESQRGTWRTNPELSGGGQLIDSGSHLLDALLWTTGADATSVAVASDDRDGPVDVNTALAATLEGPDGPITASIGISGDGTGFEEGLVIWGTEGHLQYDDRTLSVYDGSGEPEVRTFEEVEPREEATLKVASFVETVRGERGNACPGEFGVTVTALTEAAYEAHETGQRVDVAALTADAHETAGEIGDVSAEASSNPAAIADQEESACSGPTGRPEETT